MSRAFQILAWLEGTRSERGDAPCKGAMVTVLSPVENDYHRDQLPTIPAGTKIQLDFGGDFGFYGVADVNGVLHKVKVELNQLHLIDFSDYV